MPKVFGGIAIEPGWDVQDNVPMNRGAAETLVSSLKTIARIYAEESANMAQMRADAARLSEAFEERLRERIADPTQSPPP